MEPVAIWRLILVDPAHGGGTTWRQHDGLIDDRRLGRVGFVRASARTRNYRVARLQALLLDHQPSRSLGRSNASSVAAAAKPRAHGSAARVRLTREVLLAPPRLPYGEA